MRNIKKGLAILVSMVLVFMNVSGYVHGEEAIDFSQYITSASLKYKEADEYKAYTDETKLASTTPLLFQVEADVPVTALSTDYKINYVLPDGLNLEDTTSSEVYLKGDETKSIGSYNIANSNMVIDLSSLDYGNDQSKSILLNIETTTSHLTFTDSEAKIYFKKATLTSPSEVMVSVLQTYQDSIIKSTDTNTKSKKSTKQVITTQGVSREGSVSARAGDTTTDDSYTEISGNIDNQVKSGLSGKYRLTGETTIDKNISGNNAPVNISHDVTIDLNGQKLQLYDGLYFDIHSGGHLTIIDSISDQYKPDEQGTTTNIGNLSTVTKNTQGDNDKREVPVLLDYYVTSVTQTESKTGTTDTTKKYHVDLSKAGRIYSETGYTGGKDSCFMIEKGGTLDFKSGVAYNKGTHVVATKGEAGSGTATMNLLGGYLIGDQAGNVIYNNAGNVLNISGGVITNGKANNGGGIYNSDQASGTYGYGIINLTGGIITGNEANGDGADSTANRYSGGGIYMQSGTLNISGDAYITNNKKSEGSSSGTHFSVHGGGGIAADNNTQVNMSGGYVTGNYSHEAGGGLYIGYFTQSGNTKFTLSGGTIASNVAQTGEGGGIRIGGAGRGSIRAISTKHPIYITNNTTNTGLDEGDNQTGDWGGGGIFVQQNGQLSIMNVIITANTADGFGAGVSACPTGNTQIATDQGAAIYNNTAKGEHYSRGSGTKNEDAVAYDFYKTNNRTDYQDYFLAHAQNVGACQVTNGMLGKGSENYSGTFNNDNDASYEQEYTSRNQTAKFIGLSAHPSDTDINNALKLASTYISGNHSHNHGGGIMTNGILNLGESNDIYPALKLNAYKDFQLKAADGSDAKKLSMNTNQFKFAIYQHTGDSSVSPQWNGTKFTKVSGTNNLISEFGNENVKEGSLGKIESDIPSFLYNEAGPYTFYLVEEDNEDTMITYDHAVYVINFNVKATGEKTVDNIKTIFYSLTDFKVSKVVNGNATELNSSDYTYDSTASTLTLYNSTTPTFTNTEQAYDLSIIKNDKEKTERLLKGAEFTLYQLSQNYSDESINTINISKCDTQTTDENGKVVFKTLLRDHLYYLKETKAPEQYETSGPWIIEITDQGKVKIYDADATESDDLKTLTRNSSKTFVKGDGVELTNKDNVFTTTISDTSIKYTMPNTGGKGTYVYYQVGILLITLVNILWIVKRRVV